MEKEKQVKDFNQFKLNKQLLNAIDEMGYETPSPIQEKSIPLINAGHDIFGIAQTGTGKTAAYLLPILMKVKYPQGHNPRALILTPTRELALQVNKEIEKLGKYTGLRHTAVYGGVGPKTQIEEVSKGIDILVGTPGRILDIYNKGELILKDVRTMVLDEADRIMDMGFMPQIRKLLEILPAKKRQNLLFSATMPEIVVKLSEEFLEFPQRVEITPQATTAEMVDQHLFYVPNFKSKLNLLEHFLQDENYHRIIVFAKKRQHVTSIGKYLERKIEGEVKIIHANKGQNSRINAIEAFKEGDVRVLAATDVAARGIDVSMVSHVINFDVPVMYEDYVHRVGRTGRANNQGIAITFCNPAEKYHLQKIEELIDKTIPVEEMPSDVLIEETPFDEKQEMARKIDAQRKKEDPNYQGAFHEKKKDKAKLAQKNKSKINKSRARGKTSAYIGSGKKSKSTSGRKSSKRK